MLVQAKARVTLRFYAHFQTGGSEVDVKIGGSQVHYLVVT
jgi:hypothetical protein